MKLPQSFINSLSELPIQPEDFLKALEQKPLTSIRLNPNKPTKGYGFELNLPVKWCNNAYYLKQRPSFTLDPLLHAGAYYVQEASSMFLHNVLSYILPNSPGVKVLDLCAAPGGKSTLISNFIGKNGLLVSNEYVFQRSAILKENTIKWGSGNTVVTCNKPSDFRNLGNLFNCIVVDAPCSGEGLFRKQKTAVDEWSPKNVELCAERQLDILNSIWDSLEPNGYLIYSTCTYNTKENEELINAFAQNHDFDCVAMPLEQSWGILENKADKALFYRFFPHLTQGEGFSCCILQKSDTYKGFYNKALKHGLTRSKIEFTELPEGWKTLINTKENRIYASNALMEVNLGLLQKVVSTLR